MSGEPVIGTLAAAAVLVCVGLGTAAGLALGYAIARGLDCAIYAGERGLLRRRARGRAAAAGSAPTPVGSAARGARVQHHEGRTTWQRDEVEA